MNRQAIESSMIVSAGYDPEERMLEIEFTSGAVYRYYDVPEDVYNDLLAAESAGRTFDATVRDVYEYERASGPRRRR